MWDIPRWYISACCYSAQYVRLHPILMSILLHDYKELTQCISEVERVKSKELEKEEVPTTLDSYFIENKYSRRVLQPKKAIRS